MNSVKAVTITLSAACLAFATTANANGAKRQPDDNKARLLLQKTLERTYPQNVVALILQRSPDNASVMQRIQVQISRDGKIRQTVIYPLSMEGVETIDDGNKTSTYLPDRNLLLVQDSPHQLPNDAKSRMQLTIHNYELKLGGTSSVAGRTASIVIAIPKAHEMDTRRYYIDDQTGFLLQLETVDQSGQTRFGFRAQAVNYPASISPTVFQISNAPKNCEVVPFKRPKSIMNAQKQGIDVGFEPIQPTNLPFGFTIQDIQVNGSKQWRSVAVRITDGLVKGTVYQWLEAGAGVDAAAMPGTNADVCEGIRIVVAADVSASVRKRILQVFADAARRAKAETPGLFNPALFLELSLRQISLSLSDLPSISISIGKLDY